MDLEPLRQIGLSDAESTVYVNLLELGSTTTGPLIERTGLQSSTVYHVLSSLKDKGLVSYVEIGKIKHFSAASPDTLLALLESRMKEIEGILPALEERHVIGRQDQGAAVHQGIKGLRAAFYTALDTLEDGDRYYFFEVPKKQLFDERLIRFLRTYHQRRESRGIEVHGLAIRGTKSLVDKVFNGIGKSEIRYVEKFLPTGLIVFPDRIVTLDWDEIPTAFVIRSNAVADSYRQFFFSHWESAAP